MGGLEFMAVGAGVLMLMILSFLMLSLYKKCGPNEAMIVSGLGTAIPQGGVKVIVGGGTVVLPMLQQLQYLSLESEAVSVAPKTPMVTKDNVSFNIEAVAQVSVKRDTLSIAAAAEQFLGKGKNEYSRAANDSLTAHLRQVIGTSTAAELPQNLDRVSTAVQNAVNADLEKVGLTVTSFLMKEIIRV